MTLHIRKGRGKGPGNGAGILFEPRNGIKSLTGPGRRGDQLEEGIVVIEAADTTQPSMQRGDRGAMMQGPGETGGAGRAHSGKNGGEPCRKEAEGPVLCSKSGRAGLPDIYFSKKIKARHVRTQSPVKTRVRGQNQRYTTKTGGQRRSDGPKKRQARNRSFTSGGPKFICQVTTGGTG